MGIEAGRHRFARHRAKQGVDGFVLALQLGQLDGGIGIVGQPGINGGAGIVFGDGLRCAGSEAVRIEVTAADPSGNANTSVEVSTNGQAYGHTITSGETVNYQCWYRDDMGTSPCGNSFNTTNGYTVVWST